MTESGFTAGPPTVSRRLNPRTSILRVNSALNRKADFRAAATVIAAR
jgi:hypothetical protein